MIDAARRLFLEQGYDAVTLADVVKASGGSLATLYALFEGKAGLLAAVVDEQRMLDLPAIERLLGQELAPRATLTTLAHILRAAFGDRENVALMRIVMGEGLRNPGFARTMFECSQERAQLLIEQMLADWNRRGMARIGNTAIAASHFFALAVYDTHLPALLCACPEPTPEEEEAAVRQAINLFIQGYGVTDG